MPLYAGFPMFHGRVFEDRDLGTFVAPASGMLLLRVELSCDVRFWSDVTYPGCSMDPGLHCQGSDASDCAGGLTLTVTPGAYVDDNTGATVTGRAKAQTTVVLDRMEAEAQVHIIHKQ